MTMTFTPNSLQALGDSATALTGLAAASREINLLKKTRK